MRFNQGIRGVAAVLGASGLVVVTAGCTGTKWSETPHGTLRIVANEGGATLGYSSTSGVGLLVEGGYAFKDLNQNGTLDPFEDWRLSADERAKDLASRMSVEQIAGLMLYSAHQAIPAGGRGLREVDAAEPVFRAASRWVATPAEKPKGA